MRQYYLDTSVLLVYTLAGGSELERHTAVRKLFDMIEEGRLKAVTSFYALHEMYLFALENAPDFDIGAEYGKEAVSLILNTKIQVTPLLSRIERKINERFFRHLPDMSDMPHAVSAKIWGCDGIVAYDPIRGVGQPARRSPGVGRGCSYPTGEQKQRSRQGIRQGERKSNEPETDGWQS